MKNFDRKIKGLWLPGFLMVALLFGSTSCYYEDVVPLQTEVPTGPVSYEMDIQPFFDAKCNACHAGSAPPNLSASVSYGELISGNWINTEEPETSPLYLSIEVGGSMEAYATLEERALLLAWIQQGASNN